jgi:hypothetical protein
MSKSKSLRGDISWQLKKISSLAKMKRKNSKLKKY